MLFISTYQILSISYTILIYYQPDMEAVAKIKNAIEELKNFFNVKTHKELADALGVTQSAIDAWKNRGNLPAKYEKYLHDINIQKTGHKVIGNGNYVGVKNFIINEKLSTLNEDDIQLIENLKKLSPKKQEYYYHRIKADLIEEELDK